MLQNVTLGDAGPASLLINHFHVLRSGCAIPGTCPVPAILQPAPASLLASLPSSPSAQGTQEGSDPAASPGLRLLGLTQPQSSSAQGGSWIQPCPSGWVTHKTCLGSCLMTGFCGVVLFYYGAFNLTCFRMTMVGGKCWWGRFLLGHPLSEPCVQFFCSVWHAGLESRGICPCQQASQDGKAKRNSINTTILQAWFFSGLSFFWHQGEHFKLMRKCNRLIYLDAFNVSLTLARGAQREGRENQNIMLHRARLYALGLAGTH